MLVTALYDIGRDQWQFFRRSFNEYLSYFSNVLGLNVNLIVYSDETVEKFVLDRRKDYQNKTKTYRIKFSELEYYQYRQHINDVIASSEFRESNDMLDHPEAFSVEYLILMNNKISFLADAVRRNPFNSTHFFWIDAGYGHGEDLTRWKNFQPRKLASRLSRHDNLY